MTIKDNLLEQYENLLEYRIAEGYSISTDLSMLKPFIDYVILNFGDCDSIDQSILDSWLEFKTYNRNTQISFIATYRHFARFLLLRGEKIFFPDREYSVKKLAFQAFIMSDDELANLFYAIDQFASQKDHRLSHVVLPVMYRMMYCCGMRPQEPIWLKRRDVDLETGDIYIRKTKNSRERHIIMLDDMKHLCALYDHYFGPREWFFENPETGDHFRRTWMTERFRLITSRPECTIKNADLIRPYDLRHNFATRNIIDWIDQGRDIMVYLPVLSNYMGHASIKSTMYYVHMVPERLKKSPGVDWELLDTVYGGADDEED